MSKYLIFIIFITEIICAQNAFEYPDSLYNTGNYFDAITEYKRILFFNREDTIKYYGNYKIAECYKQGAKYDNAVEYFGHAMINSKTENQLFDSKIQLFRVNLLRKTYDRAEQLINEIENDYRFADSTDQINYWKGWLMMFTERWKRAEYYFSKSTYSHELKNICESTEKQLYSVTKAKVLSYIIPGSGQFYSGNYISGLFSLAWVGLSGYLTANAFISNRIFDGLVWGDLLFLRFYKGNIENAENFAVRKNDLIFNKTMKNIQENYRGIKP